MKRSRSISSSSSEPHLDRVAFAYKVESSCAHLAHGECVRSPVHEINKGSVCLRLFPRGTLATKGEQMVSAFVEVIPDVTWASDWSIPDVKYSITVVGNGQPDLVRTDTHTYTAKLFDRGWHDILKWKDTWDAAAQSPWLNAAGEMCFKVSVSGDFGGEQPLDPDLSTTGRMWVARKFTDVVVAAEGGDEGFPCHCSVLAVASPVFERMLSSSFREGADRRIVLQNVSAADLSTFVKFIYTNKLPTNANLAELLRLADMYQLPQLAKECVDKFSMTITASTAVHVLETLALHKAIIGETALQSVWEKVQRNKKLTRAVALHMLRDDSNAAFRQSLVQQLATADEATFVKLVHPAVSLEVFLQKS